MKNALLQRWKPFFSANQEIRTRNFRQLHTSYSNRKLKIVQIFHIMDNNQILTRKYFKSIRNAGIYQSGRPKLI